MCKTNFWGIEQHNWSSWTEKLESEVFCKSRFNNESDWILDYRVYSQTRFCKDCEFRERKINKFNY